jgi:hypothetical protein
MSLQFSMPAPSTVAARPIGSSQQSVAVLHWPVHVLPVAFAASPVFTVSQTPPIPSMVGTQLSPVAQSLCDRQKSPRIPSGALASLFEATPPSTPLSAWAPPLPPLPPLSTLPLPPSIVTVPMTQVSFTQWRPLEQSDVLEHESPALPVAASGE